jgi:quercetin dioxygenase-like cupin family protein
MELLQGNVFIREMRIEKAGDVIEGHAHNFDHTTYIAKGAVRIDRLDGEIVTQSVEKRASDGRNFVLIKAGVKHRITALEDKSIGHCIYAHRDPQGNVVQEYDGWSEGNT